MGNDDSDLYDENGYPVDPDDTWMHDQLYDVWGDPVATPDGTDDWRHVMDPDDEVLPSGYTRKQYKQYGATDGDIEYWGLDQPGAPEPEAAGWVAWAMADEMDQADGCGFLLAAAILWWLAAGLGALAALGRWVG